MLYLYRWQFNLHHLSRTQNTRTHFVFCVIQSRKERDVVLKLSQMALKEKEEEVLKQRGPGKYNITETNLYLKGITTHAC